MSVRYTRVGWQDAPSTDTPIDAANLNHMDNGILALSEEVDTELPLLQEQINDISEDIDTQIDEKIPPEVSSWLTEHVDPVGSAVVVDNTLSITGAAADAKKTGDEISDLKDGLSDMDDRVTALEQGGSGSGLTEDIKQALLQVVRKVAYVDTDGRDYYNDLRSALYPHKPATAIALDADTLSFSELNTAQQLTATVTPEDTSDVVVWTSSDSTVASVNSYGVVTALAYGTATITATAGNVSDTCSVTVAQAALVSISAVYTQSGTVYDTDSLDSLRSDLVVTALYDNQTTATVTDYTLSGTLTAGTSTITVSYGGKTTTFNVVVTDASIMSITQGNITNGLSETDRVTVIFNQTTFNPSNVMTFTAVDGYQIYVLDMNADTQDKAGTAKSTNKLNVYAVTSTGVVYSGNQVKNRLSFALGWDTAQTITCTATDFSVNCTGYGIMIKSTDGSALTPQQARSVFTKVMG